MFNRNMFGVSILILLAGLLIALNGGSAWTLAMMCAGAFDSFPISWFALNWALDEDDRQQHPAEVETGEHLPGG